MSKIIILFGFLITISGCGKITDLSSSTGAETEQTGDPIYDSQSEMKLLLPWNWFL